MCGVSGTNVVGVLHRFVGRTPNVGHQLHQCRTLTASRVFSREKRVSSMQDTLTASHFTQQDASCIAFYAAAVCRTIFSTFPGNNSSQLLHYCSAFTLHKLSIYSLSSIQKTNFKASSPKGPMVSTAKGRNWYCVLWQQCVEVPFLFLCFHCRGACRARGNGYVSFTQSVDAGGIPDQAPSTRPGRQAKPVPVGSEHVEGLQKGRDVDLGTGTFDNVVQCEVT